jgi:hypothetical protein
MRLNNSEFTTDIDDGMFLISITQESDLSLDGGHSFEDVSNTFELTQQTARDLLLELKEYLGDK